MKIRSMQSIPDSGTCPKTAKHRAEAHGATNRTGDLWLWDVLRDQWMFEKAVIQLFQTWCPP